LKKKKPFTTGAMTLHILCNLIQYYSRNKSWMPECVGRFNINWRISAFYPEPEAILICLRVHIR